MKRKHRILISALIILLICMFHQPAFAANAARIGMKQYATLQDAFKAVGNGQTVVLLSDVSVAKPVTLNKNVKFTLDMTGRKLKAAVEGAEGRDLWGYPTGRYENALLDIRKGNITIKGGTISGSKWTSVQLAKGTKAVMKRVNCQEIISEGSLTIDGGKMSSISQTTGSLTIKNGTISGGKSAIKAVRTTLKIRQAAVQNSLYGISIEDSKATISGGTYKGKKGSLLLTVSGKSTVAIKGGSFTVNHSFAGIMLENGKSSVTISNGTFLQKGNGRLILSECKKLKISGGTFKAKKTALNVDGGTAALTGGTFSGENSKGEDGYGTVMLTGGSLNISGGKISNDTGVALLVSSNKKLTLSGGTIFVKSSSKEAPVAVMTGNENNDILWVKKMVDEGKWKLSRIRANNKVKYTLISEDDEEDFSETAVKYSKSICQKISFD